MKNNITKIKQKNKKKIILNLKIKNFKSIIKKIITLSKKKKIKKKIIQLLLKSKKTQIHEIFNLFSNTDNLKNEIAYSWKKINPLKLKLNKKIINLLKKKNKQLFRILTTYWKSKLLYKKIITLIWKKKCKQEGSKKIIWNRLKIFLQFWILKIFNKNINLKLINQQSYHSRYEWKKIIRQSRIPYFNKKNLYLIDLTKFAIDLKRYNKYDELLFLCSREFEKQKKHQHQIIKTFYNILKIFKPDGITTYIIQINGRVNGRKRRVKLIKKPLGSNLKVQQFYKDFSYFDTQSRPRIGTFGLQIWIEHFVDELEILQEFKSNKNKNNEKQTTTKKNKI